MDKVKRIDKLYKDIIEKISSNEVEWIKFLKTAAHTYNNNLDEQLLIFAQRPDATALLSFDDWHKYFNRNIRSGSKGIAVFTDDTHKALKHLFDVKQTVKLPESRNINLWKMSPEVQRDVKGALSDFFMSDNRTGDFSSVISQITNNIIDNDIVSDVNYFVTGISDDENMRNNYCAAMKTAINNIVLYRCGQIQTFGRIPEAEKIFSSFSVPDFYTFARIVNNAVQMELYVVAKKIREIEREREVEKNGTNIHGRSGRITVPRSDAEYGGRGRIRGQIWLDIPEIHQGKQISPLQIPVIFGATDQDSSREKRRDSGESRSANGDNDGSRRSDGRPERPGYDEVGWHGEQHKEQSGGNSLKRAGVQLARDNRNDIIKAEDNKSSAFSINQNEYPNYRITNDFLGVGGAKEKFRNNIKAVKLLHQLRAENRIAMPKEQEILSQYVGWGGLSMAFDENNAAWRNEYKELKELLTPDEYRAAKESTLTAFYTPPAVIRSMYQALVDMGFSKGNILEPACATGHFFGLLPETMSESKLYGIELDTVSGQIAQQLYPAADIRIESFEDTRLPDNKFDIAIGNIPFGDFKVDDVRYRNNNFLIHDYFFAKVLDKVRSGGIIMFITSKGTLDKVNSSIRDYISKRAELVGAVRLPDNTFKANAGTQVTSDIIILKKIEKPIEKAEGNWINVLKDSRGIMMNEYFVKHPEMVLGDMRMVSGPYGMESACKPKENENTELLLKRALSSIAEQYKDDAIMSPSIQEITSNESEPEIIASEGVRRFSYFISGDSLYFKEGDGEIGKAEVKPNQELKIRKIIPIRDYLRELIQLQLNEATDKEISFAQKNLMSAYKDFYNQYGLINNNKKVFTNDNAFPLISALEKIDGNGNLKALSDIFYKRTIKPKKTIIKAENGVEAVALSINEKGRVDMDFMCSLLGKASQEIEEELKGIIYRVPSQSSSSGYIFQTADEYLSGNVREKLELVRKYAETTPIYNENVAALEKAIPEDLKASEISVRLGSTWIPQKYVEEFTHGLLSTPEHFRSRIRVHYNEITSEWHLDCKNINLNNVKANKVYGTSRINAYQIIEETLNLRDVKIYDYILDENGNRKAILNSKETAIALGKQDIIKEAFQDWIWKEQERREKLVRLYNDRFNSFRVGEFKGDIINFDNINDEIELNSWQKNAVARTIFNGNSLYAHVVGAGKTYTMVAAAMESKRMGLCNKSMVVVPNNIINQFANEWLDLYPSSNILVATEEDFKPVNRKRFCSRIAMSDVDAVIIGHSQFEKIPLSKERQKRYIQDEIDQVSDYTNSLQGAERSSIKGIELVKKRLQAKLKSLNDDSKKDNTIYFEELGCDRLFVDEADLYKNLYTYTKMQNVSGVNQADAKKASDLFLKCRYINEITNYKGLVFATGTPISNSMSELYTMQRYLQPHTLKQLGISNFDEWASVFGETVTALELAPEGTGYRLKTRFSKFNNIPELMSVFRQSADIQTADMIALPRPKAKFKVVSVPASVEQKEMVNSLAERAKKIRDGGVDPKIDNMLKIVTEGRKLALDQRLINPLLPDDASSKVNACVKNVYDIWEKGRDKKTTQLVFCDLSTPGGGHEFNVYDDIKNKLLQKGVPCEDIAYIHDAKTSLQKKTLFEKVRSGDVRILIGSTAKMGAGTNVQDRVVASHDLDCPYRPRDLEQRMGRSVRQGNQNSEVQIIRYVTEGTFDAYMFQLNENKQKFISQILSSKNPARSAEDIDETTLSYAEIKMIATGNPLIKEKMDLDIEISKLKLQKQRFLDDKYDLEHKIQNMYPDRIRVLQKLIQRYEEDLTIRLPKNDDAFDMILIDNRYTDKGAAGERIAKLCKGIKNDWTKIGEYRGFELQMMFDGQRDYKVSVVGKASYTVVLGESPFGNITRIDNVIDKIDDVLRNARQDLNYTIQQMEEARKIIEQPFEHEKDLELKIKRVRAVELLIEKDAKKDKEEKNRAKSKEAEITL